MSLRMCLKSNLKEKASGQYLSLTSFCAPTPTPTPRAAFDENKGMAPTLRSLTQTRGRRPREVSMLQEALACWRLLAFLSHEKTRWKSQGKKQLLLCTVPLILSFLGAGDGARSASAGKLQCTPRCHSEVSGEAQAVSWETVTSAGLRAMFSFVFIFVIVIIILIVVVAMILSTWSIWCISCHTVNALTDRGL